MSKNYSESNTCQTVSLSNNFVKFKSKAGHVLLSVLWFELTCHICIIKSASASAQIKSFVLDSQVLKLALGFCFLDVSSAIC